MSNFAAGWRVRNSRQKIKIGPKGAWPRSRDLLLNFWNPFNSGSDEATIYNFAAGSRVRNAKQKK